MSPLQPARSPTGRPYTIRRLAACASILAAGALLAGCGDDGDTNIMSAGSTPATTPASTIVERSDPLPGVVFEVTEIAPGTGPGGNLQAGDTVSVTFTLLRDDGTALPLAEMDGAVIILSGPTENYQRVFPQKSDVKTQAVENLDGSYTYTFADPLPAVYAAPINDTADFGLEDGELKGEPLRDGTYTVAVQGFKNYTVDGETFRDSGVGLEDLLVGSAMTITTREVVKNDNCNQCHVEVRAHGKSNRLDVRYCVLCHTAGAEDNNDATLAGGTPGVTIDFRTMIHKIHNGVHLPSVQGVSSAADGSRQYDTATAVPVKPYQVAGGSSVHDFSHIAFPVWPSLTSAMPRDLGYSALSSAAQGRDNAVRQGVVDCARCHGDPDGAGPLTEPAQGDLVFAQPTRNACGSCHDDIDWALSYDVNSPGFPMPPQPDDTSCKTCHDPATLEAEHLHPFKNPTLNAGIVLDVTTVVEAGTHDSDGNLDPGEKVAVTFTVKGDGGAAYAPTGTISATFVGPLNNRNRLLGGLPGNGSAGIPAAALNGQPVGGPYTVFLPEPVTLELLGTATAGVDVFTTSRSALWDARGAATSIMEFSTPADITSGNTTLSIAAVGTQNYLEVASVTGFAGGNGAAGDFVRLSDGVGPDEYAQVGYVENGSRLVLKQALRRTFPIGSTVVEVTRTTRSLTTHYTVDAPSGTITEVSFTTGRAIVASYTADFVMPSVYLPPGNDSPDLDETWGEWTDKPLVTGLYRLTLWTTRAFTLAANGETQNYSWASLGATKDVDVGTSGGVAPTPVISSEDNCYACHVDVIFHGGGRRGLDTCLSCHGTAGIEDKPLYLEGQGRGAATTGITVDFRQMLHRIHMGEDLADAENYVVTGHNGSLHVYDEVVFPPMTGGTKNCTKCHGEGSDSWKQPASRDHPTDQGEQVRVWAVACTSCHNDPSVAGHAAAQTGLGLESCLVCHGPGKEYDVEAVHLPR